MWLKGFLVLTTLILSCYGGKDTSCNFDYNSGWCSWGSDASWMASCGWKLYSSYYERKGYVYLDNGCSASFSQDLGMFTSSKTNYLTIEYYVVGTGPFTLSVSHAYGLDWQCTIQTGKRKRKAHVLVTGNARYITIKGKVGPRSRIVITQIWNTLQGYRPESTCPPLTTTPKPTTRPTTTPTTTKPTTTPTTTIPTTTPTTTIPTTTIPTTLPTTTIPTTLPTTTIPTTTIPTTTPTTIKLTTAPTTIATTTKPTTTPKTTTPKTTNPTTTPTTITTTLVSTTRSTILSTTIKTTTPTTRKERSPSIPNVATFQSTLNEGLASTTSTISKRNTSPRVAHSVSTHPSTWTVNAITNRGSKIDATKTSEMNPTIPMIEKQTKPFTGRVNTVNIQNTQPTSPMIVKMTTGKNHESTPFNVQIEINSAEIGKEKKKHIIIGGIVGVSIFLIIVICVINYIVKRKSRGKVLLVGQSTANTVTFTNKAFE